MTFPYFSSYFSAHVLLARYPRRIATSPLSARSMNWVAPPSCCGSSVPFGVIRGHLDQSNGHPWLCAFSMNGTRLEDDTRA